MLCLNGNFVLFLTKNVFLINFFNYRENKKASLKPRSHHDKDIYSDNYIIVHTNTHLNIMLIISTHALHF